MGNTTCEYKYKIGNVVHCEIEYSGSGLCINTASKCTGAKLIESRKIPQAYYSFQYKKMVRNK